MKYFSINGASIPFNSHILLGVPSFGKIGQLAIDCVIATLSRNSKIVRIGFCDSDFLLPMIGFDSFAIGLPNQLCHPIEVFQESDNPEKVYVVVRSLCIDDEECFFAEDFSCWLSSLKFASLLILTGAELNDWDIQSQYSTTLQSSFVIGSQDAFSNDSYSCSSWKNKIPRVVYIPFSSTSLLHEMNASDNPLPSGMEVAGSIMKSFQNSSNDMSRIVVLGNFSGSGYHLENSMQLSSLVLENQIEAKQLNVPASWSIYSDPLA